MDDDLNGAPTRTRPGRRQVPGQTDDAVVAAAETRRPTRPRLVLRRRAARLEFDPLAAYLGLLIGITVGLGSPAAAPVLQDAALSLCATGAFEVGRDGAAECLPR